MDRGSEAWRERAIRDAVLGGDTAAWRAWYDEHSCRLAGYVNWRCGGIADLAEDVLQETWLVAIKRLKAFDPGQAPFAAWLRGIAANAVRNALRSRRRNRVQPLEATSEPAAPCQTEAREKAERVAWLQLFADGTTNSRILVREYGLLITHKDLSPPDAMSVFDFWNQKPEKKAEPAK